MSTVGIARAGLAGRRGANGATARLGAPAERESAGRAHRRASRRRLAVILAAMVCGLAAFLMVQPGVAASTGTPVEESTVTVTVEEGQSLWSIARTAGHGHDTGKVVAEIKKLNGLSGSALRTGQTLQIPAE